MTAQTGWWFKLNESLNHHPASRRFGCFAKSLDVVGCPSWPGGADKASFFTIWTTEIRQVNPYQQTIDEVLAALTATRDGLTSDEARKRLDKYGPNELHAEKSIPAWRKFLAQFQDVLVLLLLIATAISFALWFYERESALPYEALAISAVVLLNAIMGYIQESRAETAVAALRQLSAAHANVIGTVNDAVFPQWKSFPATSSLSAKAIRSPPTRA